MRREEMLKCVRTATAAPSIHNTQPWRFGVVDGWIEVFADQTRRLEVLDPAGRQLLMSVGAAVFNLRVAMLARGWIPVQTLLPDPDRPDLIARVRPGPAAAPGTAVVELAEATQQRHTDRSPFRPAPVPWSILDELAGAAAAEGARLTVTDPVTRDAVLALTRTAEDRLVRMPAYLAELAAWTGTEVERRDGIPLPACGPRDAARRLPLRDFTAGRAAPRRPAGYEPRPTIALLITKADRPRHWVRAGQALERVLLTATARGLSATPMNQALEIDGLRRLVTDQSANRFTQAVLRLGYGGRPTPAPATPRRPVGDVLA